MFAMVGLWSATVFLAFLGIGSLIAAPKAAALFFLSAALVTCPKLSDRLVNYRIRGWRRTGLAIALFVIGGVVLGSDADESKKRAAFREQVQRADALKEEIQRKNDEAAKAASEAAARKKAEDERNTGLHCLSAWDGSNVSFKAKVKEQLRDPDSFEHDETRIAPLGKDGRHAILMKFRARNGFGGVNRGIAIGTVDPTSCDAAVLSVE